MSKENELEDDPDMQEFLEWADQPGPWDEEDDKIHTVGGLTNDKENGFMSFVNKTKMSEEIYRPEKLKVVDIPDGGFKIVDVDFNDYELATILEFNPLNSDLPISMAKEFAEYLIGYYNHNYS